LMRVRQRNKPFRRRGRAMTSPSRTFICCLIAAPAIGDDFTRVSRREPARAYGVLKDPS